MKCSENIKGWKIINSIPTTIEKNKLIVKEVDKTRFNSTSSSLYWPDNLTIPVPVAAVETWIRIVIKFVNCPSIAIPAGPVKTAKNFAEINDEIIFIIVETEVKVDTFTSCDWTTFLKTDFIII